MKTEVWAESGRAAKRSKVKTGAIERRIMAFSFAGSRRRLGAGAPLAGFLPDQRDSDAYMLEEERPVKENTRGRIPVGFLTKSPG
jgi:hypothetical protein